jgi:cytidylate kinase
MNPTISALVPLARDIGLAVFVLAALAFFHRTSEDLRAIRELLAKRDAGSRK